jgi:gliding motility-associated-like protein
LDAGYTGLDDPSSLTPLANPAVTTTYTLTVTSRDCGIATDSVLVTFYPKITIPNTFTPNNDGINDIWDIRKLSNYPDSSVMVFNRYGQQVFQSTGYPKPWDGVFNGSPLPVGTYYYIIDLKDTEPKIAGWVLLVR